MARGLLLKRPNLLAFPGGAPGFDPSHVAAGNIQLSTVVLGGNFANILNGKPATTTAGGGLAPTGIDGVGPYGLPTGGQDWIFPGQTTIDTVSTIAAIITLSSIPGIGQQFIFMSDNGGSFNLMQLLIRGSNFAMSAGNGGVSCPIPGLDLTTLPFGTSLFVACSNAPNSSAGFNLVVRNLSTGQIYSGNAGIAGPINVTPNNGSYEIGNYHQFSVPANEHINAVMYSTKFSPLSTLLQWAQDPWSFWYPQKFDLLQAVAVQAAADALMAQMWM